MQAPQASRPKGNGISTRGDGGVERLHKTIERQIAVRLRSRRRLLGLTLDDVAARCGSTFQTVHKYEAGKARISACTLWKLAQALEVQIDYFFEGAERGL